MPHLPDDLFHMLGDLPGRRDRIERLLGEEMDNRIGQFTGEESIRRAERLRGGFP